MKLVDKFPRQRSRLLALLSVELGRQSSMTRTERKLRSKTSGVDTQTWQPQPRLSASTQSFTITEAIGAFLLNLTWSCFLFMSLRFCSRRHSFCSALTSYSGASAFRVGDSASQVSLGRRLPTSPKDRAAERSHGLSRAWQMSTSPVCRSTALPEPVLSGSQPGS